MNRYLITVVSIMAVMLVAVGVASGQIPGISESDGQSLGSFDELPLFDSGAKPLAADLAELKALVAEAPEDSILASVDLSSASGIEVAGSMKSWIVQASGDGICAIDRELSGGLGSSCTTIDEFNKSGLITVSAAPNGKYLVTVVQLPGVGTQLRRASSGDSRALTPVNGVSSAVLSVGDTLTHGKAVVDIAEIDSQRKAAVSEIASRIKK